MFKKLFEKAKETRLKAYVPYSKFYIGASLITKDGQVYGGCNIENASFGLTNCAERTCLFKAYSEGIKKEDIAGFLVIGDTKGPISPCGACRQVMSELLPDDCKIYLTNLNGDVKEMTLAELLPYSFKEIE